MQSDASESIKKTKKKKKETEEETQSVLTREHFLWEVTSTLIQERHKTGETQEELNFRLGIADRLVNKWECGLRTPSGFNLYCWANALGQRMLIGPAKAVKAVFTLNDGTTVERDFNINAEDITK